MKILALKPADGSVTIVEAPSPLLPPGFVRVRTAFSAVSAGTEGNKVITGRKSLLGKARSRPDQVRQVIEMARSLGLRDTLQKVRAKLHGAQPLGYSLAGEISEVGEGVTGFEVGDPVACAGGGYANHADEVTVPVNLVARVPDGVPLDAAAMTTLGAIALQGVRLSEPTLGEHAVVIGLGLIGQIAVQLLRAHGCRVLGADISPEALELARKAGAAETLVLLGRDSIDEAVSLFTRGHGADLVLICAATSSNEPVVTAGRISRQRGRVVVVGAVGMDLPRAEYYEKEIGFRVSCSYGPGRYDPAYEEGGMDYPYGFVRWTEGRNMEAVLDMQAAGRIDLASLVTHRFPFDRAPEVYQLISSRSEPFCGVLLEYPAQHRTTSTIRLREGGAATGDKRIGVGCIGAGSYAQSFLLPFFRKHDRVELTAITTRTGLSAVDVGRRFGFRQAAADVQEVLNDPDTRAVVIATRHDRHGPDALAALRAGKHVFVEKPLCLDLDQLRDIAAVFLDEETDAPLPILQVGFNRRFSRAATLLRDHFGSAHGPLVMHYDINAGFIPPDHWIQDPRQGGGRIIGEVCHFIDLMQFICGADPTSVYALCVDDAEDRLPQDNVQLSIKFADGSVGTISYHACGARTLPKERFAASCGERSGVIDNFRDVHLYDRRRHRRLRSPGKGQQQEIHAFIKAVGSGKPAIPIRAQLATTLATLRALESLRSGEPLPVDLDSLGGRR